MVLLVIPTALIVLAVVAAIGTLTYLLDRSASRRERGGGS
jgi:hypothetical protein